MWILLYLFSNFLVCHGIFRLVLIMANLIFQNSEFMQYTWMVLFALWYPLSKKILNKAQIVSSDEKTAIMVVSNLVCFVPTFYIFLALSLQ
jgi:hypothetical protein